MKFRLLLVIVVILLLMCGCSKPSEEDVFYNAQKFFNKLDTYRCIADVTVIGNKDTANYKLKHVFKKPDKYVVEILEPLENEGNIVLYDGNQIWLYNKQIDESFVVKDIEDSASRNFFIGFFIKNILSNENVKISFDDLEDKRYLVLEVDIPGNNKFRNKERLWLDSKGFYPYKLLILDKDGEVSTEIRYSEFEPNVKVKDEDFNIKTGLHYIRQL